MQWKLDELLAAADAAEVARSIGMRTCRSGATTFVENVDGRQETRLNHVKLFRDGCKDFTTGKVRNTYSMVRDYYANCLGRTLAHDEICEIIADTCGGADLYVVRKKTGKKAKKSKPFPFTNEELELIGLRPANKYNYVINSYTTWKDEKHERPVDLDGYANVQVIQPESLYRMYQEEPETALWLIAGKTQEMFQRLHETYQQSARLDDCAVKDAVLEELKSRWESIKALAEKLKKLKEQKKAA